MVLTLSTMALPNAGTTGATLGAGMTHALHERNTAARTRAPVVAVGDLDAAALYEHREPVTLAAYDLGDPEAEVDVEREGDRDIARGQGGERVLSGLYTTISKKKKKLEKRRTLMQRSCIKRRQACWPVGNVTRRRPPATRTLSCPKADGTTAAATLPGAAMLLKR